MLRLTPFTEGAAPCRPRHLDGVRVHRLGDDVLLYAPDREEAHAVNASGYAVWELCDGTRTELEVAAELAGWLGTDPDTVLADVRAGIAELVRHGLLELT